MAKSPIAKIDEYRRINRDLAEEALRRPDDPQWAHLQAWAREVLKEKSDEGHER